jgi:hypothetical protein
MIHSTSLHLNHKEIFFHFYYLKKTKKNNESLDDPYP